MIRLVFVAVFAMLPLQAAAQDPATEIAMKAVMEAMAKQYVADKLPDPQSARFRRLVSGEPDNSGIVRLCGEIDGKNADGAYAGYKRFVVLFQRQKDSVSILGSDFHDCPF